MLQTWPPHSCSFSYGLLKTNASIVNLNHILFAVILKLKMTSSPKKKEKSEAGTAPAGFLAKLKKSCKNCSAASIAVYFRNARRLYKLINKDATEPPVSKGWLANPKMFAAYRKLPLKARRHISIAAVKACKALGVKPEKWQVEMLKDASLYERQRNKNEITEEERAKWPKHGIKSLKRASSEQLKRIRFLLKEKPSMSTLYKYQVYLLLKLYGEVPFRNTWADFSLKNTKNVNYMRVPKKGGIVLVVRAYKNANRLGEREVKISRGLTTSVRKFLKYREQVVKHDWVFSNQKGEKISRGALGKMVHVATKAILGRSFGSRLIRLLHATSAAEEIKKVSELSNKMLHKEGSKQTRQYVRKEKEPKKE